MRITLVESTRDRRRFIGLPWDLYNSTDHPRWVPPLRRVVAQSLDTRRNPFYRNADIQLFLAEKGGRAVGRIAAIQNRAHNAFHRDRVGFFGFFEASEDQEVADGLFEAAGSWLSGKDLQVMRGPVSPSTNHETGLLTDGFDVHPMILTPWNPPLYPTLVEGAGLEPVKELLAYHFVRNEFHLPHRFALHAERARRKTRMVFRDVEPRHFEQEMGIIWSIYNTAWEGNWGFVPLTEHEFRTLAQEIRHLLLPQFSFIAEVDGEPAGFLLFLPDFNRIFKAIGNGRLFPTGFARILHGKRRLRTGRIFALGIRARYRSLSIFPLFASEIYRRAMEYGAQEFEASWILEDNTAMNSALVKMGAEVYRRWRIYEKTLGWAE